MMMWIVSDLCDCLSLVCISFTEKLFLTSNDIEGELPTEFGQLTQLERLKVSRNYLKGTLPSEIGLMTNLGTYITFKFCFRVDLVRLEATGSLIVHVFFFKSM
jgi:hypothetical protein